MCRSTKISKAPVFVEKAGALCYIFINKMCIRDRRGEAGRAGITDISQKAGALRFTLDSFDMARVSELYARPEYRGRLRVEAGSVPRISLKLPPKARVLDEASRFAAAWASTDISSKEDQGG